PGRNKAVADGGGEFAILDQVSRITQRHQATRGAACSCAPRRFPCRLSLRRAAPQTIRSAHCCRLASGLVARRTNIRARCAVAGPALEHHALPPGLRWNHCRRRARGDRSRSRARAQTWCGMNPLAAILVRDMRLAVRIGGGAFIGALFFLIVITMTPFAVGPDLALLARIGPAILWLGALLASLLALEPLFSRDHDAGSLDLLLIGSVPLELTVAAKALAHWLTTGLPLVVIAPLLGLMLNIDLHALGWLALTLAAGTPALTFIGLIGAALSVALRRGGLLLAVLVLPLTVPVLIFGVAAANAAIAGPTPFGPAFTILCALSLASLVLGPIAATAALRHGLE